MMKRLLALALLPAAVLAQSARETPANLFFDTDYAPIVPDYTLSYGVRGLFGANSAFSGTGYIESVQGAGEFGDTGITRSYHDGYVQLDNRTTLVDDGTGRAIRVPITPDGYTNSWNYGTAEQRQDDGTLDQHTYTATIADSGGREKKSIPAYGIEVLVRRDLGGISARFDWTLLGGVSVNGINTKLTSNETAEISKLTDTYVTNGDDIPDAPYTAPSSVTEDLVGPDGLPVTSPGGTVTQVNRDTTVLLEQNPIERTMETSVDDVSVSNFYKVKGAYFTFRAGPTVTVPFSERLRASMSAGAALVYAGSTYSVQQTFTPETGTPLQNTVRSSEINLLPGFYADLNMHMTFTEWTGAYLGLAYQNTGSYAQKITQGGTNYRTRVELDNLMGVRMGLNVRF